MKINILIYFCLVIIFYSCANANKTIDKRKFKKSKSVSVYTGMANEFEDGYLVLKENGYFKFYQKFWFIVSIKQGESIGQYSQSNDTLYLNWLDKDPKQIKHYLSKKCIIDSSTKSLWFIDEQNGHRLWEMRQSSKK